MAKDGGKTILKHCGLSEDKLNFYTTSEPFAYYTVHKQVTQTVLIIENKDTFTVCVVISLPERGQFLVSL